MVRDSEGRGRLFSYLDIPRKGEREPVKDMVVMAVELMKFQGEVAYEIGKKQAMAITSTASTIGIGWSAFFFGIAQESWLTTSIGLMVLLAGTYLLGFWTPRVIDKARTGLDKLGAARFYDKWFSDYAKPGEADKRQ